MINLDDSRIRILIRYTISFLVLFMIIILATYLVPVISSLQLLAYQASLN